MKTEIRNGLATALRHLAEERQIPAETLTSEIVLERCKNPDHGDFASNLALIYAKRFALRSRELAELLVAAAPAMTNVAALEVAGPGFINIRLAKGSAAGVLEEIVNLRDRFGCNPSPQAQKILLEFVSANPTGPLHVGHGRGAAYGDSLANLLRTDGHQVDKEYYVNDAGRQMDILALSVYWRYMQHCGVGQALPKGIYQGAYVGEIAAALKERCGSELLLPPDWIPPHPAEWRAEDIDNGGRDRWIDAAIAALKQALGEAAYARVFQAALEAEVADIREDLAAFGVHFERWFSERSLFSSGMVDKTLQKLEAAGYLYEKDGAIWFRAEAFGDEKDRVVRRENGVSTYFASDIAYHLDKYERGYDRMIDIFGADHHGYMARVRASLAALDLDPARLHIALVQFAVLYQNGEKVQMSTRSGEFVTLRELREQVGSDAARFFYVMRKPEQHLDFDMDLAVSHSKDNPYYYVQYAHARTCRVLERAREAGADYLPSKALPARVRLTTEEEQALLRVLGHYRDTVASAAVQLAPQMIVGYLRDLATAWHKFYDAGHKVLHEDEALRAARLLLTDCVGQVLRNGLAIVGVKAQERM